MTIESFVVTGTQNYKQHIRSVAGTMGFTEEVILEMPSERINAAVTPALASGYAMTLQRLKILAHALPRTRGKP